jgi:Uma2 family endonuclease
LARFIERFQARAIILRNPILVVEVLSESNSNRDQGIKWFHYRMLPGLKEFITIEQDRPLVDVHSLNAAGQWVQAAHGKLTDIVQIHSLGVPLRMAEIYANLGFE